MFKFVVLSVLIAVSTAAPAPGNLWGSPLALSANPWELSSPLALSAAPWGLSAPAHLTVAHQPLITKQIIASQPIVSSVIKPAVTGHIVQHVPTSVSHQSSSVVHSHGQIVSPIITPVQKTIISHAPVIKTIAAPGPLTLSHGWNSPVLSSGHGWNSPVLSSGQGWNSPVLSTGQGWNSPLLSSW